MSVAMPNISPSAKERTWKAQGMFWIILLFGMFLCLYALDSECPWSDEILTLQHFPATSLRGFLQSVQQQNAPVPPLYFAIEYGWSRVFGYSVRSLRLLSMIFGCGCLVVLYRLARDRYGHTAGLIAMLCLAVNHLHIYYAQEIRQYAMVYFLALLSVYCFLQWVRHWRLFSLLACTLANALLIWTHYHTGLLLVVEGIVLLLFYWRSFKRVVVWTAFQLPAGLGMAWWLYERMHGSELVQSSMSWLDKPSHIDVLGIMLHFLGKTKCLPLTPFTNLLHLTAPIVAVILLAGFLMAVTVMIRRTWFHEEPLPKNVAKNTCPWPQRMHMTLLLLWMLLPIAVLGILSHLWIPMLTRRYVFYCAMPMYIIIGACIAECRHANLRRFVLGVLLILCAHQALHRLALTPTRVDWRDVGAHIVESGAADDPVYVAYRPQANALRYYTAPIPLHVENGVPVQNSLPEDIIDQIRDTHGVWVIRRATPYGLATDPFEQDLQQHPDLHVTRTYFPARLAVCAYHLAEKP